MHKTEKILHLCARTQQNPDQQHRLVKACTNYKNWPKLLDKAEEQGMSPLLNRNLISFEKIIPDSFVISLRLLSLRHRQTNALLIKSLQNVLELLGIEGIPVLVLKGAALSQTVYPEIGLRPMRDIDLFLPKEDVLYAHTFLQKNGFQVSTSVIPADHFHLPALYQTIDGFRVCIELHQDLLPTCPPYHLSMPFTKLYQKAIAFDVGGITAYTLATEEMLWHLYQHGFRSPLTYEQYKLISVADIVNLVEKEVDAIDWRKIELKYPELFNALPYFHYITPWSERVLAKIPCKKRAIPSGVGERFNGWPQLRLSQQKDKGFINILLHTFLPSQWWILIYYAPTNRLAYIWCRVIRHPLHILWWMRLYGTIFYETNIPAETDDNTSRKRYAFSSLRNAKILIIAMYKKFR